MEKINIIILGSSGKMGSLLCNRLQNNQDYNLIAKVDICGDITHISLDDIDITQLMDCIVVDFSTNNDIIKTLSFCKNNACSLIIARTDLTKKENEMIKNFSKYIKIFQSGNFSMGIKATTNACKEILKIMPKCDIEIVETHHTKKIDAPSGTAKMLKCALEQLTNNNITTHSLRIGNVVGEHEIIFATDNEIIKLVHIAQSKELFIDGCMRALNFVASQNTLSGYYTMDDL